MTLDELGGEASKRVAFVRTDAKSLVASGTSNTKVKAMLKSPLEPQWPTVGKERCAEVMQHVKAACAAGGGAQSVQAGTLIGLRAASRALQRGELRAVILARESQNQMLSSHLPLLAQLSTPVGAAQQATARVVMLPCSSGQLGQLLGMLRVSAVGLSATEFGDSHPLMQLLAQVGGDERGLFPWLHLALERRYFRGRDPGLMCG